MSVLAQTLGASVPHTFTHRNKTYKVTCITHKVKCAYAKRLFDKARQRLEAMRDLLPEDGFKKQQEQIVSDYLNGEYDFESPRGRQAMASGSGAITLGSLLFDCDEDEMTRLMMARQEDIANLVQVILKESFGDLPEGDSEGNAQAPVQG